MNNQLPNTTPDAGMPVPSDEYSLTVGPSGPVLLQDAYLIEKLAHFVRERIPDRVSVNPRHAVVAVGAGCVLLPAQNTFRYQHREGLQCFAATKDSSAQPTDSASGATECFCGRCNPTSISPQATPSSATTAGSNMD